MQRVPSNGRDSLNYGVVVALGVEVDVAAGPVVDVATALVLVAATVPVVVAPPITITTNTSSPKNCPPAVDIRQLPFTLPVLLGATIAMDRSIVEPEGTDDGRV